MSCSGRTMWCTPSWLRILACGSLMALAQISGVSKPRAYGGGKDAGFQVVPDRDDDPVELVHRQLPQRLLARRVGAHHLGETASQRFDNPLVGVDSQHLDLLFHQLQSERGAKPAQAQDGDRVEPPVTSSHIGGLLADQWSALGHVEKAVPLA